MKRRDFLKRTGQTLLITSAVTIIGSSIVSCKSDDDDNGFYNDGYYDDGYYDDGYYDDGY
ncbi:hypothetical protein [Hanstruepera ponticola]|uniref:hypothetical protein n=1 Tax=Hanstruepera ponticola TaxID=2042995 RepID=UPI000CF0B671|nr:hypothetical protein [Hanstruepera ponticola]